MPSMFPDLLTYGLFVPVFFRLFLAWSLIFTKRTWWSILLSIGFLIGIATQIAALVYTVILIYTLVSKRKTLSTIEKQHTILMCIVSLSLVFLGAGLFSFDLPL